MYFFDGEYHEIIDTSSYYMGISQVPLTKKVLDESSFRLAKKKLKVEIEIDSGVKHEPVDDAKEIVMRFYHLQKALKTLTDLQ